MRLNIPVTLTENEAVAILYHWLAAANVNIVKLVDLPKSKLHEILIQAIAESVKYDLPEIGWPEVMVRGRLESDPTVFLLKKAIKKLRG